MSTSTTPKYKELLIANLDPKKVEESKIQEQVDTAKVEVSHAELTCKKELNRTNAQLKAAFCSSTFNVENIITLQRKVAALEEDLNAIKELEKLF
jgi:hypothetical protein